MKYHLNLNFLSLKLLGLVDITMDGIKIKLTIQEAVLVINQVAKTDHQQSVHLAVQIVMAEINLANLLIKCEAESV